MKSGMTAFIFLNICKICNVTSGAQDKMCFLKLLCFTEGSTRIHREALLCFYEVFCFCYVQTGLLGNYLELDSEIYVPFCLYCLTRQV